MKKDTVLKHHVVPDRIDLRDLLYMPPVRVAPKQAIIPDLADPIPVLDQGETSACTGFALASVVYYLQRLADPDPANRNPANRPPGLWEVSPYMLYSMARRYDEFPGDPDTDTGSSLRGAMKGWYKHGVCAKELWKDVEMPSEEQIAQVGGDWWMDAMLRPLGAYYRVDTRSITDMQIALNEVGILYASAVCHKGWREGFLVKSKQYDGLWPIPYQKADPGDLGHAFAIIGYNSRGFIVQNSWGQDVSEKKDTNEGWGRAGCALLTYNDWLDNAMDCWVAQMGVVTELRQKLAGSQDLRVGDDGKVLLAANLNLRIHELSPYIIDMENNGRLSNTGQFRTQDSDLDALVNTHLRNRCNEWGLGTVEKPIDIAIVTHGGLVDEDSAWGMAEKWIPALYDKKIFPIFLMWETDRRSTLINIAEEVFKGQPRMTGGWFDAIERTIDRFRNERLENLFAIPGTVVWDEMKENAKAVSYLADSGGVKLYNVCQKSSFFKSLKARLHLVGHSAGAILHSHIIERLGWTFESVNFMAPAVSVETFRKTVLPAIRSDTVKQYNQFHLSDDMEQKDPSCKKELFGYSRSLLYLVSRSFERGVVTPILGLEKDFDKYFATDIDAAPLKIDKKVQSWSAPGQKSKSITHGEFSEEKTTMDNVIKLILEKRP